MVKLNELQQSSTCIFLCMTLILSCWMQGILCKVQRHVIQVHQRDTSAVSYASVRNNIEKGCPYFENLLKRKTNAVKRFQKTRSLLDTREKITAAEKEYQLALFKIFVKELNETEEMIVDSAMWLQNVLKDIRYKDLISLRDSSQARLQALNDAALKEEVEHRQILEAEERFLLLNQTHMQSVLDEVLGDIANSADILESGLNEHVFDEAVEDPMLGGNIETVVRIAYNAKNQSNNEGDDAIKLVDAQENQFVLSKGKDSTVPQEDPHFLMDVILILLVSTLLGWLCLLVSLPTMFGYVVTGLILGPSGLAMLKSLVQIETLGEFGVFFILFSVGLEFSPDKLKKVMKVAIIGTCLMMLMILATGMALGIAVHSSPQENIFLSVCLFLSSTPLVIKFLNPNSDTRNDEGGGGSDYDTVLMGILIMQDVLLGLLMAILPNLAKSALPNATVNDATSFIAIYGLVLLKLIAALVLVILICYLLSQHLIRFLYRHLINLRSKELVTFATISLAFLVMLGTDQLSISMELGCFLAGVTVSAQGHELASRVEGLIQPIKDVFSCIFFASIGLHVFPQFLVREISVITTFTIIIVSTKYVISVLVLSCLIPRSSWHVKWIVSAGLAQVSEYSFVLGSRARKLKLISREVYLLILGVTTLSLLFAPVLWKITLWQLKIRQHSKAVLPKFEGGTSSHSGTEDIVSSNNTDKSTILIKRTSSA